MKAGTIGVVWCLLLKLMKQLFLLALVISVFGFENILFAQSSPTIPTPINGVEIAVAKILKKPKFPVGCTCVFRRNETVVAEVETDSYGKVYKVTAISGHPLLRKQAELAAKRSTFTPSRVSNVLAGAKFVISYGFIVNNQIKISATIDRTNVNPELLERCSDCTPVRRIPRYVPKPIYPSAALYVQAEGKVEIEVVVTEDGNVELAKAISGHPLLRASAMTAAKKSKFEPTTVTKIHKRAILVIPYEFHKH